MTEIHLLGRVNIYVCETTCKALAKGENKLARICTLDSPNKYSKKKTLKKAPDALKEMAVSNNDSPLQ